MKTMRTDAHLSGASKKLRQLVAHIETERTNIRIASFTAKEAQDIRVTMLRQLGEVLEELYKVRDAKQLATEEQMHAVPVLIRADACTGSVAVKREPRRNLRDSGILCSANYLKLTTAQNWQS